MDLNKKERGENKMSIGNREEEMELEIRNMK